MSEVKSYAPGTFCWYELTTTDTAAAKKFYSALFGWTANSMSMPDGGDYTMLQIDGKDAAALSGMSPEMAGTPPHWGSYISVADVEKTAKKAASLGATVIAPAFDVMDAGRMAVLMDPTGAKFSLWQPGKHIGATIKNVAGTAAWLELATKDVDAAGKFYSALFGWTFKPGNAGDVRYTEFELDQTSIAGMLPLRKEWGNAPSHWMIYFGTPDCDAMLAKATALGGRVMIPGTDIPGVGRFGMVADPQGAMFALLQPRI